MLELDKSAFLSGSKQYFWRPSCRRRRVRNGLASYKWERTTVLQHLLPPGTRSGGLLETDYYFKSNYHAAYAECLFNFNLAFL